MVSAPCTPAVEVEVQGERLGRWKPGIVAGPQSRESRSRPPGAPPDQEEPRVAPPGRFLLGMGEPPAPPMGPPSDTFAVALGCGFALHTRWSAVAAARASPHPRPLTGPSPGGGLLGPSAGRLRAGRPGGGRSLPAGRRR